MKKLILSSVVAGVVYSILLVIFGLLSRVVNPQLLSFFFGCTAVVFFRVIRVMWKPETSFVKSLLSLAIMLIIFAIICRLLVLVAVSFLTVFVPSLGWGLLGFFFVNSIVRRLHKRRKTRLTEKQRQARLAELMNK